MLEVKDLQKRIKGLQFEIERAIKTFENSIDYCAYVKNIEITTLISAQKKNTGFIDLDIRLNK